MLQTCQKVFRIVPKCPKMPTSDASLSERTCFLGHDLGCHCPCYVRQCENRGLQSRGGLGRRGFASPPSRPRQLADFVSTHITTLCFHAHRYTMFARTSLHYICTHIATLCFHAHRYVSMHIAMFPRTSLFPRTLLAACSVLGASESISRPSSIQDRQLTYCSFVEINDYFMIYHLLHPDFD